MSTFIACETIITYGANTTPRCDSWVEVDSDTLTSGTFDVSQLDPVILAEAFGSGVVVFGVVLASLWTIATVINFIRS
jgi:hypothetical protein